MTNTDMEHLEYLHQIASADVAFVRWRESTYQGSWKRRGGVGAWMMATRKSDRLEILLGGTALNWDVFRAIREDPGGRDGTVLAELRDLRQYLLLIEAEMMACGSVEDTCTSQIPREEWPEQTEPEVSADYSGVELRALAHKLADDGLYESLATYLGVDRATLKGAFWQYMYSGRISQTPEPGGPGTPEDGGHHAAQESELDRQATAYEGYLPLRTARTTGEFAEVQEDPDDEAKRTPHIQLFVDNASHGRLPEEERRYYFKCAKDAWRHREILSEDMYVAAPEHVQLRYVTVGHSEVTQAAEDDGEYSEIRHVVYMLDRSRLHPDDLEQMDTHQAEMNLKEFESVDRDHRGLYSWHEAEGKYRIRPRFELWARR